MNSIFFLIIAIISLIVLAVNTIPVASAEIEKGINYDREFLGYTDEGDLIYEWSQIVGQERILYNDSYENYIFTDTAGYLRFESETISFEFYKNSCDFK